MNKISNLGIYQRFLAVARTVLRIVRELIKETYLNARYLFG